MSVKTYMPAVAKDDPHVLMREIEALEMRANALHLFPCARALNNAKNAAGWQLAGNIEMADAASTHRQ